MFVQKLNKARIDLQYASENRHIRTACTTAREPQLKYNNSCLPSWNWKQKVSLNHLQPAI